MAIRYHPRGIHTANMPVADTDERDLHPASAQRFITLAPQVGADDGSFLGRLIDALNERDAEGPRWKAWDQNLIAQVSAATKIPTEVIESVESHHHSVVDDLFTFITGGVDEMTAFHRFRQAVRELAESGHAVLIGHGATFMTAGLPGGVHVRLIAPMRHRIKTVAQQLHLTPLKAGRHIRRLDRHQRAFFARYWPTRPLSPELFTATLNVAELSDETIVRTFLALLSGTRRT